jgi:FkbM family methyltransferase
MKTILKAKVRRFLPKSARPHSILAGPLRGAMICTSWHDYPGAILGTTEKLLLGWFRRNVLPGETWIDIGAHYGYTAIALCRLVGPNGRVVAFEPVLSTAGCVARTRQLNGLRQLQIIPVGLASCAAIETRWLPLIRGMADSTILQNTWEEQISVASFDTVWGFLCNANPAIHGVKIDVQGMELDVLAGMRRSLRQHKPKLIVEFHAGVDRRSVIDVLLSCGYGAVGEPIDLQPNFDGLLYCDNHSYAFHYREQTPLMEQISGSMANAISKVS